MRRRVLFYVQHLLGVGHAKRAAALARAMARRGLDVMVVLGGEAVPLADFGDAQTVQLSAVRAADTTFRILLDANGRRIDEEWWQCRVEHLLNIATDFAPHALLIEHFPFGRRLFARELEPLFHFFKGRRSGPILCSVRDVLVDKKDPTHLRRTTMLLRTWFDRVLVHGDPSVIPFGATFRSADEIKHLISYTGYVVDDAAVASGTEKEAGRDEIVVSIGGGAVGEGLLDAAIKAAKAGALAPRRWRALAGANLPESVFAQLRAQAGDVAIVERARPDFRVLLTRAALSISQAGYNTLMDVLVSRCRALVVPFAAEGEGEQLYRAREFERRGMLALLEEHALSPQSLARAAQYALTLQPRNPAIDLAGAVTTAAVVVQMLEAAPLATP
jgi:predicted glycosyltransferase